MMRSKFDPDGGETDQMGSQFTPPDAVSNLPDEFTHHKTAEQELPASPELLELEAAEKQMKAEKDQKLKQVSGE